MTRSPSSSLATGTRQASAPFFDEWAQTSTAKSQQKENQNISIRLNDGWYRRVLTVALHHLTACVCLQFPCPSECVCFVNWCRREIPAWACRFPAAPLYIFFMVHFVFISSKLERVNSIPRRQWLRLGTFTISPFSFALATCSLCLSLSRCF